MMDEFKNFRDEMRQSMYQPNRNNETEDEEGELPESVETSAEEYVATIGRHKGICILVDCERTSVYTQLFYSR